MYKVTYLNPLDNKRYTLLDKLSVEAAVLIKEQHSNKNNPFHYLPDVRIEKEDDQVRS